MAICTVMGHVARAIDFYHKKDMYFCIGKTSSWSRDDLGDEFSEVTDYDANPPVPKNTDTILELAGYKKVESAFLVVPDDSGDLEYRSTKWKIVTEEEAPKQGARWVYISSYLSYNELPTDIAYRQIGVVSGVEAKEGIPSSKFALLPEEVEKEGLLEVIDNRKPVYRDMDIREHLKLIIEF